MIKESGNITWDGNSLPKMLKIVFESNVRSHGSLRFSNKSNGIISIIRKYAEVNINFLLMFNVKD